MARLEFRILGPFEVRRDGEPVDLGPPRQRALLVALLLHANHVLGVDQLIDMLWGESPPASARHSLHVYVANLRKVLGHGEPQVLVTRTPGYSLAIDPDQLDANRFEAAAARGRALLATDPTLADEVLGDAMAQWRDEPFVDFAYEPIVAEAVGRLHEVRLRATEDHIDAQLALGRHAEIVGDVEAMAAAHPFRERLWGQWILALYRGGRQADALRVYQQLRTTLRDELGVEPSRELRDLEIAVLDQDPRLDLVPEAPTTPPAASAVLVDDEVLVPRHWRWPIAAAVSIAIVAFLATSDVLPLHADPIAEPVAAAADYEPRFVSTPCPPALTYAVTTPTSAPVSEIDHPPTSTEASCGSLSVPQDRDHPEGRWIDLPVGRIRSHDGHPGDDPTIVIGNGVFPLENPTTSPALDHGDLVIFPTRLSWGPSPNMACPEFEPMAHQLIVGPQRDEGVLAQEEGAYRACYQRLTASGVALEHYGVNEAAADVVDLLRALGVGQVNLVADEDDSRVAFQLVRHRREVVRSLTLESPIAPGRGMASTDNTAQLARAFDAYTAVCRADAACNRAYPDLEGDFRSDWEHFRDQPETVSGVDTAGVTQQVWIDGDRFAKVLGVALMYRPIFGELPSLLAGVSGRTATDPHPASDLLLGSAALSADWYWARPQLGYAIIVSDVCSYERYTISPYKGVSANSRPELAGVDDGQLEHICGSWPVPKAPADVFEPLVSDVPTFIVEGELSYRSSPEWVDDLRSGLSHSSSMLFPTLGSSVLFDGLPACMNDLRRQFLADPTAHLDTDGCAKQSPPINFVVGPHGSSG
jgi:DNA-binding SARP family transcriptional activator/pimeloyl-ACP methyl ester carboxylesterase